DLRWSSGGIEAAWTPSSAAKLALGPAPTNASWQFLHDHPQLQGLLRTHLQGSCPCRNTRPGVIPISVSRRSDVQHHGHGRHQNVNFALETAGGTEIGFRIPLTPH